LADVQKEIKMGIKMLGLGFNAYIARPLCQLELIAYIRSILKRNIVYPLHCRAK